MTYATTEEQRAKIIENFCGICDRFKPGKSCGVGYTPFLATEPKIYGTDQERYAMKNLCGWATVNGRSATINNRDGKELIEFKNAEIVTRDILREFRKGLEKYSGDVQKLKQELELNLRMPKKFVESLIGSTQNEPEHRKNLEFQLIMVNSMLPK